MVKASAPLNYLSSRDFLRYFTGLILLAWTIPAVVGLSFILYINVLTPAQMQGILLTPTEPAFILIWLVFAVWYFRRYIQPVIHFIDAREKSDELIRQSLSRMKGFPLHFWSVFLLYLALAPASVILSAEYFTDYVAQPVDWFRIHLVALIVSIIVGLPIFFIMLDLFGRALHGIRLRKPHVTIKTKVFMIGSLVPLLIDTMLVQYYWTRTGFFTVETFFVWLFLEVLAIIGSLIFAHSFAQSLSPIQQIVSFQDKEKNLPPENLQPFSTDELGVLTSRYQSLLEDLYQYRDNLEQTVQTRTRQIEEQSEELKEKTDALQAANREMQSFCYSVSHDLRAPLRGISGFSEAILQDYEDKLDDLGREYLYRIKDSTHKMASLIDGLLQLSRISRTQPQAEEVNLSLVAEEILQRLSYVDKHRQVEINIEEELLCEADRGLMIVMMENVLGNAWKYTSKKEQASIEVACQRDDGQTVYYIRDNGSGFEMKHAGSIFEPFKRLHGEAEFPGSGIGLATCQKIVQLHGGEIWVDAEPDKGMTLYFTLQEVKQAL